MERSLLFTCLLADETFSKMEVRDGEEVVTKVLHAWQDSESTDMFAFVQQWLADHPLEVSHG